jgi:hypothetical protein
MSRSRRNPGHRGRAVAAAAIVALLACAGCNRDAGGDDSGQNGDAGDAPAAPTPGFAAQGIPYTVRALDATGRVAGFIEIDGAPPPDSVVQPTADPQVCGARLVRRGIDRRGDRAIGVVVWLDGLRSGKPLPLERRFQVTSDRCVLVPEIQAAIAGGTLNVRSLDAVEHRTRIARRDAGELLATIRETDEGQVVPNERVLARPGILELSCEVHPWTRGWIAVFDHPYFVTSGADGSFAMDSVPPGRYQVHAWHPRLGAMEDDVTVEAGTAVQIVLRAKAIP